MLLTLTRLLSSVDMKLILHIKLAMILLVNMNLLTGTLNKEVR